jgi:ATP-binding cassette, subfamily B, bacterial
VRGQALTWRRLAGVPLAVAVVLASVAAAAETAAATVAGQVAAGPTVALVGALAVLLIGSAGLDMGGRVLFSGVVGRAEGRLRADLLRRRRRSRSPCWRTRRSAS